MYTHASDAVTQLDTGRTCLAKLTSTLQNSYVTDRTDAPVGFAPTSLMWRVEDLSEVTREFFLSSFLLYRFIYSSSFLFPSTLPFHLCYLPIISVFISLFRPPLPQSRHDLFPIPPSVSVSPTASLRVPLSTVSLSGASPVDPMRRYVPAVQGFPRTLARLRLL
jgi:hypothetical protein